MIDIIYACHSIEHDNNFVCIDNNDSRDWWLLLLTNSPAFFIVNEQRFEMPAQTAILYPPHAHLNYGALGEPFVNDWIRFRTDEEFITHGKVPFCVPFEIKEYDFTHYLFMQISSENFFSNTYRESSIKYLFKLMFYKLEESLSFESENMQIKELIALRISMKNNPGTDWNIPDMAKRLHISPGYFHTLYKKTFGITCIEDLISMRIDMAKDYLLHSNTPIYIIATLCGYNTVEHFSRQFKQYTGLSPRKYRTSGVSPFIIDS